MMEIRTEPKPDGMTAIYFITDLVHPEPEDDKVRAYLTEWDLTPKWERDLEVDGQPRRVMYFGECYLRGFFPHIAQIIATHGGYVPQHG